MGRFLEFLAAHGISATIGETAEASRPWNFPWEQPGVTYRCTFRRGKRGTTIYFREWPFDSTTYPRTVEDLLYLVAQGAEHYLMSGGDLSEYLMDDEWNAVQRDEMMRSFRQDRLIVERLGRFMGEREFQQFLELADDEDTNP